MVSLIWSRIGAWLFPSLAAERDLALERLAIYAERCEQVTKLAADLAIENRKLKTLVEASRSIEAPKIHRAATPAEVRRLTEHAFSQEEA